MTAWYDCRLSYEVTGDNEKQTKVTENYLVDAINLTEAEVVLTKQVGPYISNEFKIDVVKREKVYELFESADGEGSYFKAKVAFIILDEEKGKEKRINGTIYVQSSSIEQSLIDLKEHMKGTMSDYEILSVAKSKILEVIKNNE